MLSLCPLTLLPCSPLEVIDAAAEAGFDAVGVRLTPTMPTDVDVMADPVLRRAIRRRLAASGIAAFDVEVVRIGPDTDVEAQLPLLAYAGELGARRVTVAGSPGRGGSPDHLERSAGKLAELCEAAARFGVRPQLEFMMFRGIGTLGEAQRLTALAGHPDAGLCIDALHLHRSGGSAADIAALDPAAIASFHICDAAAEAPDDLVREARFGRLLPGHGALPLGAMIRALPPDVPIAVETPDASPSRPPIREHAARSARRARAVIAAARSGS